MIRSVIDPIIITSIIIAIIIISVIVSIIIRLPPEDDIGDVEEDTYRGYYISEEVGGPVLALREPVDTVIPNVVVVVVVVSAFKESDENTGR